MARLMNIQTGDESLSGTPSTNFTVIRVKQDICVGAASPDLYESLAIAVAGRSQAYGVRFDVLVL